ncbi:unnamed protein product [Linum tenue]|uniref:Uncharacterized protein n=1 Tax=Linum tenue TaxID=586396 RepID=A0AAV0K7U8_9ROSI|nr:unnamed protein product [Linum tenue]
MAAHSDCDFGGGKAEKLALAKYRQVLWQGRTLASSEELAKVEGRASLLAAVDYYVSLKSDIFISASPGNMHNALTIRPNMVLLGPLFLNKSMVWSDFEAAVLNGHRNRQGQIRLRKEKQSIFTYPAPDCMCKS